MADSILVTGGPSTYYSHPAGQSFVGQAVDVVDLGERVEEFDGADPKLVRKCALVFRTGERNPDTNAPVDVHQEFTVSMGDKANLRRFLEQWRGKPYEPEQIAEGVPLEKLIGNYGLLTVAHKKSVKGRVYANIAACVGLPKQMMSTVYDYRKEYVRDAFWDAKKKEYAEGAQAFRRRALSAVGAGSAPPLDDADFPGALDEDDDLPF